MLDVALGLHVRVRSFLEGAATVIKRMGRRPRKPPAPAPSQSNVAAVLPSDVFAEQTPTPGPASDPMRRRLFVLFLDASGDGLPDAEDRCPRAPETRNQRDDEDGCPDATRVDVRR